jgi:hypothetical protein
VLLVWAGKLYAAGSWRGGHREGGGLAAGGSVSLLEKSYVLVIDCGSSGTRMNAFEFDVGGSNGAMKARTARDGARLVAVPAWIPASAAPAELIPRRSTETRRAYQRVETEPGLSTYLREQRVHEIGDRALRPLLAWAEAVVPRSHWADTPVYLLATAGLRRLGVEEQEQVLGACREALRAAPFRFENSHARVIDGREEGVFGWAALNAAEGKLGVVGGEVDTVGALDLGGSSLEVTYNVERGSVTSGNLPEVIERAQDAQEVRAGGVTYRVETTSYAGAGLDDAYENMLSFSSGIGNPCLNRGYTAAGDIAMGGDGHGGGDGGDGGDGGNDGGNSLIARNCFDLADAVVGSLNVSIAAPQMKFAAMSGFYVVNHFFGLDSSATLADVRRATDAYCALPWGDVLQRHRDELAVETYCFRGAYVAALLEELGVRDVILGYDDGRVGGWPMGFAFLEMDSRLFGDGEGQRRSQGSARMARVVVVLVAIVLLAAASAAIERWWPSERSEHGHRPRGISARGDRMGSGRSLEGMEEGRGSSAVGGREREGGSSVGGARLGSFTRSSTVSRKLNETL